MHVLPPIHLPSLHSMAVVRQSIGRSSHSMCNQSSQHSTVLDPRLTYATAQWSHLRCEQARQHSTLSSVVSKTLSIGSTCVSLIVHARTAQAPAARQPLLHKSIAQPCSRWVACTAPIIWFCDISTWQSSLHLCTAPEVPANARAGSSRCCGHLLQVVASCLLALVLLTSTGTYVLVI
jgi:hypothetical protein